MSSDLNTAFLSFTKGVPDMDNKAFVKILKDNKILDNKFTATDADLIFAKIKPQGGRRIMFADFDRGLKLVAERKKTMSYEEVCQKICGGKGPILSGTVADEVRFHDDKSSYTGVHKMGGPTTVDSGRVQIGNLSEICDRSTPNIRGVNTKVLNNKTGDSK